VHTQHSTNGIQKSPQINLYYCFSQQTRTHVHHSAAHLRHTVSTAGCRPARSLTSAAAKFPSARSNTEIDPSHGASMTKRSAVPPALKRSPNYYTRNERSGGHYPRYNSHPNRAVSPPDRPHFGGGDAEARVRVWGYRTWTERGCSRCGAGAAELVVGFVPNSAREVRGGRRRAVAAARFSLILLRGRLC
jgi:hypothetical protein